MKHADKLVTIEEVAKYLNFKPRTITKWVQDKTIPHYRLSRKTIRFDLNVIDSWLETKRNGYKPEPKYLSACCDAPAVDEVDFDSVDGYEGEQIVVATGECSQCEHQSRMIYNGDIVLG